MPATTERANAVAATPKTRVRAPAPAVGQGIADAQREPMAGSRLRSAAWRGGTIERRFGPSALGPGRPLDSATRARFEHALGHEFSTVRVHSDGAADVAATLLRARAYALGEHIVFRGGYFAPGARDRLLAHELTHVVQQRASGIVALQRDAIDDELDKELADYAKQHGYNLDPATEDYAIALQAYGYELTRDAGTVRQKPTDPKAAAEWTKRFDKAKRLSERILAARSNKGATASEAEKDLDVKRESRAHLLASDLAVAGRIDDAMGLAAKLTQPNLQGFIYQEVIKRGDVASIDHLKTIAQFFRSQGKTPADHPIAVKLAAQDKAYVQLIGTDKSAKLLAELAGMYASESSLVDTVGKTLVLNKGVRQPFSEAMWAANRGEQLYKLLQSQYFAEGFSIEDAAGAKVAGMELEADLPWVYQNKQKYYVEFLVGLGTKAGVTIPKPTAMTFAALKAWLDANTEAIGQAIKAAHPADPERVLEIYRNIGDVFFYHIDPATKKDVKPDLAGKISHLAAGAPQKMRFEADCDVLATYAMRLLTSAGLTPIGYIAIIPDDPDRMAHAGAIMQQGQDFYSISNTATKKLVAKTKDEAIKAARDFARDEAYGDPKPDKYKFYYADAGAKGEMSKAFLDQDPSTRMSSLEP